MRVLFSEFAPYFSLTRFRGFSFAHAYHLVEPFDGVRLGAAQSFQ
jgi:hypothetical protein